MASRTSHEGPKKGRLIACKLQGQEMWATRLKGRAWATDNSYASPRAWHKDVWPANLPVH